MSITINGATNTISSTGTVTLPTVAGVTSLGNTALGDAEASDTHAIKGATTILANSAGAAITVTQTGAGNSFVVEDSASTDATPFVIDGAGNVGIGITPTTALEIGGASPVSRITSVGGGGNLQFNRGAGALTSPTVVSSGDALGRVKFYGHDGTNFIQGAEIGTFVDGTPGTNDMPGRLIFSTTADGASSPTEAMRIDNTRKVHIGSNNGLGAGALNVLTASGTATAVYLYQASVTNWDITIPASTNALTFNNAGTERMRIDSAGLITARNSTGLGYGAGSGGTVTQATSKATAVTLNKPSGLITMDSAALAAGATVSFTLTNSSIADGDMLLVNPYNNGNYRVEVQTTYGGGCQIRVINVTAGSLSEALTISFAVFKKSIT